MSVRVAPVYYTHLSGIRNDPQVSTKVCVTTALASGGEDKCELLSSFYYGVVKPSKPNVYLIGVNICVLLTWNHVHVRCSGHD